MVKKEYLVWGRDPKTYLASGKVVTGKLSANKLQKRYQNKFKYRFYIREYK